MADLLGQNIGSNYKGLLNIGSIINTPLDGTLRLISDGMGNNSPFQLSTLQVGILSVIARASGTNADNPFLLAYTINNSGGTNTVTGFKINATETAIVGTTHSLMDLQVGGVSKFKVSNAGVITNTGNINSSGVVSGISLNAGNTGQIYFGARSVIMSNTDGNITLYNGATNDFNRLQFGGTTSAFPSIKRNLAGIDFRLADDSDYCNVSAKNINAADIDKTFVTIDLKSDLNPRVGSTFSVGQLVAGNTTQLYSGSYLDLKIATAANTYTTVLRAVSGSVGIGTTTPSARLHVRGDGTNPIARFENSVGSDGFLINSVGQVIESITNTINLKSQLQLGSGYIVNIAGRNTFASTNTTLGILTLENNFAAAAGSANFRPLNIAYTINNSGVQTGNATGIFLNATETALNGMTHNLLDLQVGGVSRFTVRNTGVFLSALCNKITLSNNDDYIQGSNTTGLTTIFSSQSIQMFSGGTFNYRFLSTGVLQLGGTTSSFPAIKRNGGAIDFRLADDSAFCEINCSGANFNGLSIASGSAILHLSQDIRIVPALASKTLVVSQDYSFQSSASALLEVKSTTKGFLMPRMTQAQILLIATPANGLQVYNTDLAQPCFYDGAGWRKISHTNM